MNLPREYIQFLVHFHGDRDFFECHEILEEYWKQNDHPEYKNVWHGLIQVAVGSYHHRNGKLAGAAKMYEAAIHNLAPEISKLHSLHIDSTHLLNELEHRTHLPAYEDYNFSLTNADLMAVCEQICTDSGFVWKSVSPMDNPLIIEKHLHRDRSEVVAARERAKFMKHTKQSNK